MLPGRYLLRLQLTHSAAALALAMTAAVFPALPATAQLSTIEQPDKYKWLEDIHGERSMDWVKAEDARTAAVLEKDPRFATLEAEALTVLESPDRLAAPQLRGGIVYNMWRDAQHLRGILRRTSLDDYLKPDPGWETVLDYDALSKADNQSWVAHGLDCLDPEAQLCLVSLSAGGEDAATLREMDLKSGKFVDGGFVLPRGKQRVAWLDKDTLLMGRDWGAGTMSEAGYPVTVREWKRGTPLGGGKEIFKGDVKDNGYGDNPRVFIDGQGRRATMIERNLTTFTSETYIVLKDGGKKLDLPLKSSVAGLLDGQLVIDLEENWTAGGKTFPQGSVVAVDLEAVKR